MREQKGITLVALIITIIVMLILVGVTVTTVINSGLLSSAGNAVNAFNDAQNGEEELIESITVNGQKVDLYE